MEKRKFSVKLLILSTILIFSSCGKKTSMYSSGNNGYMEVNTITGAYFETVTAIAHSATAVTNVSPDMNFEEDQTYIYKDGESQYFIFNINSFVIAAQKGTTFGFRENDDKRDALSKGNILGIWFDSEKKKGLEYTDDKSDGIYKIIATVTAEVSITPSLYNEFTGKLACLDDGVNEYSLFVGSLGNDYKELDKSSQQIVDYIASTLMVNNEKEELPADDNSMLVLGGEDDNKESHADLSEPETTEEKTETAENKTEEDSESIEVEPETENIESDNDDIISDNTDQDDTQSVVTEAEEIEIEIEKETHPDIEDKTEEEPAEIISEPEEAEINTAETSDDEDAVQSDTGKKQTITLNNQKKDRTDSNDTSKVHDSSIYNILSMGQKGYASVKVGKDYEQVVVSVDKIHTGKTTKTLIENGYGIGLTKGNYFEPSVGTTWHVAHLTIEKEPEGYLNVNLRGMDGENLRYRGITYSQRTYMIKLKDNEYYCYYEVPNGCSEYVLEVGEGTVDSANSKVISAYFKY